MEKNMTRVAAVWNQNQVQLCQGSPFGEGLPLLEEV